MVSGLSSGVVTSLWPMGGAAESITGMDTVEFLSGGEIYHAAPYYFTKGATDLLIGSGQMFGGGTMFFSGGALLVTTEGLAVAASVPLMAGGVAVAGQGVTTAQAGWGSIGQGFDRVFNKGSEGTTSGGGTGSGSLTVVDGGAYSPSEVNAARHMTNLGNNVTLRPPTGTRAGGGTSDLLVNGVRYDVYTPTTSNPARIISAIAKKNSQAEGIVLDLSQTNVTARQLGDVLARIRGAGAMNINDVVILGGM
jgi:hypothetical protein